MSLEWYKKDRKESMPQGFQEVDVYELNDRMEDLRRIFDGIDCMSELITYYPHGDGFERIEPIFRGLYTLGQMELDRAKRVLSEAEETYKTDKAPVR